MIVGNLATYPPRKTHLIKSLEAISPQVDYLNVVLNEYRNVDTSLQRFQNVNFIIPEEDTKDTGKFLLIDSRADYTFFFDDDLIYPKDYVHTTVKAFDAISIENIVGGYHGSIYLKPTLEFLQQSNLSKEEYLSKIAEFRRVLWFGGGLQEPTFVDQLGTGTIIVRGELRPPFSFMKSSMRFSDVRFAKWCFENSIKQVCLPRTAGWISGPKDENSIFHTFTKKNDNKVASEILSFAFKSALTGKTVADSLAFTPNSDDGRKNMEGPATVRGNYVNLDNSTRRRFACESSLNSYGLSNLYKRFAAISGTTFYGKYQHSGLSAGKIGCWLSHMEAIKASCDHDYHFHLLEDDFELTSKFRDFIDNFDAYTGNLKDWDILFTDLTLTNLRNVNNMKGIIDKVNRLQREDRFVIEDATQLYAAGNSSYIVNRKSKKKVADILEKGLGANMPKDIYLREQARLGNLKILVTLPFLTTLNDTFMESDILGKIDDRNPSIINNVIFRKSLSWGADTKSLLQLIKKRIAAQKAISDRGMIYTHLVAHYVSDEYKNY